MRRQSKHQANVRGDSDDGAQPRLGVRGWHTGSDPRGARSDLTGSNISVSQNYSDRGESDREDAAPQPEDQVIHAPVGAAPADMLLRPSGCKALEAGALQK